MTSKTSIDIYKNLAIFSGSFLTGYFTTHFIDMIKNESKRLTDECMNRINANTCNGDDDDEEQIDDEDDDEEDD